MPEAAARRRRTGEIRIAETEAAPAPGQLPPPLQPAAPPPEPKDDPDRDLPAPKRPSDELSRRVPLPIVAAVGPAVASPSAPPRPIGSIPARAAEPGRSGDSLDSAVTGSLLRLGPDLLRDLPAPMGPLPRQSKPKKSPAPRTAGPSEAAMPILPPALVPEFAPRTRPGQEMPLASDLRVTRPDLPGPRRSPRSAPSVTPPTEATPAPQRGLATRPEISPAGPPAAIAPSVKSGDAAIPAIAAQRESGPVQTTRPAVSPVAGVASGAGSPVPSDITAREAFEIKEALEPRMPAVKPSPRSPAPAPGKPAEQVAGSGLGAPKAAEHAPRPAAAPAAAPVPAQMHSDKVQVAAPGAMRADKTPLTVDSGPVKVSPAATPKPAENVEPVPALSEGEPPHLPMGWIIGALFMVALLLTLWIAHRTGVFGPPTETPPSFDPSLSAPPRLP